jgi:YD repeat-containing protein
MASIISGVGIGLYNSSLSLLGNASGNALLGQNGDRVYVNSQNGNLVLQQQDEFLSSLGLDLSLTRTYNSLGVFDDGDNQDNWRIGLARRVSNLTGSANTAGSTVQKTFGDGFVGTYSYDASQGIYVSTSGDGAHDTLTFNSGNNTWTWTDGTTGYSETYSSDGAGNWRLSQARDADGNATNYIYSGALLTQVKDASGQVTYLDWSGNNLSQIRVVSQGQTSITTHYAYDGQNRLSQVIVDLSPADASISDGNTFVTQYTYDGTSNRIASVTSGDGTTISFTYDAQGRVATYTDGAGKVSTLAYTSNTTGKLTTVTDPLGYVTSYVMDAGGRLIEMHSPSVNGRVSTTVYGYDDHDNVTSMTDGNGNVSNLGYNADGTLAWRQDAAGNRTEYTYNAGNQLLNSIVYLDPDSDGTGPDSYGTPVVSRNVYDSEGHLRFSVSAEGRVSEQRYNTAGQLVSTITYTGGLYDVSGLASGASLSEAQLQTWVNFQNRAQTQRVDMSYDFRGNLASTTSYASVDSNGNGIADGTQAVTLYVYDQHGRVISTIDPRGSQTANANDYKSKTDYDGLGRVTRTYSYDENGTLITSSYVTGATSITAYDDAHHKITTTIANGLVTTSAYDARGLLLSQSQIAPDASPLGTTTYHYDADGRLRYSENALGYRAHILYDADGRTVATVDQSGALVESVYDDAGNVVRTIAYANRLSAAQLNLLNTDAAGGFAANVTLDAVRPVANDAADRQSFVLYDSANRPVLSIAPHDTDPTLGYATQTFYDGAGRVTDVIEYANAVDITSLSIDSKPSDVLISVNAAEDRHVRTFYSADGLVQATISGEGYVTENVIDGAGKITETINYAESAGGNYATDDWAVIKSRLNTGDANNVHTYSIYDSRGQLIGVIDGEGYLTESVYTANGKVAKTIQYANRANAYTAGAGLAQLRPVVSSQDRITSLTYTSLDKVATQTDYDGTITHYQYDVVGRLVQTDRAWNTADIRTTLARYDVQGRVIAELSGEGAALLTGGQTQAQIDAIWDTYGISHTYDVAGRRTSSTDQNGHTIYFYYNELGQQIYAVNSLGEVSETVYNSFGQTSETRHYATRIDVSGFTGGVVTNQLAGRVQAAKNDELDTTSQINYTLRGAIKRAIDAFGQANTYSYNSFGELGTENLVVDNNRRLINRYSYDRQGQVVTKLTDDTGYAITTSSSYDAFGRVVQTVDGNGNVRNTNYDKNGRVISTEDPFGNISTSSYDAFGRVLTQTDALGHATSYAYDDANHSVSITTPEGIISTTITNRHGEQVTIIDGNGNTTTFEYDKNGKRVKSIDAEGNISRTNYDNAGLQIETINADGTRTLLNYDAANRLLTRTVDPNGLNLVTSYEYDAKGQVIRSTDAAGLVTETQYDKKGQVVSVTVDPNGLNLTTTYTYDARGKKLTVTEAAGTAAQKTTAYLYDKLGRRVQEIVDPDGLNIITAYTYDNNGNVIVKTDANGNPTTYYFDGNDRVTHILDSLGALVVNEYDANGQLIKKIAYANVLETAAFSTDMTVAELEAQITPSSLDNIKRYVYDDDGRLIFNIDALGGVSENVYDNNGNVVTEKRYATGVGALADYGSRLGAVYEVGQATVSGTPTTITLKQRYQNAVVIVGPASSNDADPGVVKVMNVTGNSFDIAFDEYNYQDGVHAPETVAYMVLEAGRYTMADGSVWEAGTVTTAGGEQAFQSANFAQGFAGTPSVFLTQQSNNDDQAMTLRLRNINANGFQYAYSEEEGLRNGHVPETLGYLAIYQPAGSGSVALGATSADYTLTTHTLTHTWGSVPGGQIKVEEEQSGDSEVAHTTETVSVLHMGNQIFAAMQTFNGGDTSTIRAIPATAPIVVGQQGITLSSVRAAITPSANRDQVFYNVYDALNQVVFRVDANNHVFEYEYDSVGNLITEKEYVNPIVVGTTLDIASIRAALTIDTA